MDFLQKEGFVEDSLFYFRCLETNQIYRVEQAVMVASKRDSKWLKSKADLDDYYRISAILYPKLDDRDGIDHINIYSKAKTNLGKFLSNFTRVEVETEDGLFMSVEGYWYWLSCKDDHLRTLSGFEAKRYGRGIKANDWCDDEEFKRKICGAIKNKVLNSQLKKMFAKTYLPLKHYYSYGGKIVEPQEGKWILEYLEELRKELKRDILKEHK